MKVALPTPVAVPELVITGALAAADATVNASVRLLPDPPPLAAAMTIENVPAAVGVPEMTPLLVLRERPVGRFVAAKLVGLLLAVIV